MMRRRLSPLRLSPLCATPIAGALLVSPGQVQVQAQPQVRTREPRVDMARQGPIPTVSAAAPQPSRVPAPRADTPAAAQGRRIVSTAFVRLAPDGWMQLGTRRGQVLRLRGVTMEARAVCGVTVVERGSGKRRCIDYADIATARAVAPEPGDAPAPAGPGTAARER